MHSPENMGPVDLRFLTKAFIQSIPHSLNVGKLGSSAPIHALTVQIQGPLRALYNYVVDIIQLSLRGGGTQAKPVRLMTASRNSDFKRPGGPREGGPNSDAATGTRPHRCRLS